MITKLDTGSSEMLSAEKRLDWPVPSYISAWQAFRGLSDEDIRTAEHLVSRAGWPTKSSPDFPLRLLDLGCGDGRMIEAVARVAHRPTLHLVDPDDELLEQAAERLRSSGCFSTLRTTRGRAENLIGEAMAAADAVLAVHLIYLLSEDDVRRVVQGILPGIPVYFVLDHPESVFTCLWQRTARKYYDRVIAGHATLSCLAQSSFQVRRSEFESKLENPLLLPPALRDAVMTLLSYATYPNFDSDLKQWVTRIINDHMREGVVRCRCVCYEVVRVGKADIAGS